MNERTIHRKADSEVENRKGAETALPAAADGADLPSEVETLTAEIQVYKQQAGACIVEIGRRLARAKELLPHGAWSAWLAEKVEFSERSAQNFMRVAKEYSNPQPVADLGLSKALLLLQVPENERAEFVANSHEVDGEEKQVAEMSKRELEQVIRERDEARKAAEAARADAETWKNTADAKEISLQNAKKKVRESETAAKSAELALAEARKLSTQAETAHEKEYANRAAQYAELEGKLKAAEEAAKAEPIQAEVVPDEETLQKIRAEVLAEQAAAVEAAEKRAADAAERLEKAKNPTALRVSLWFADVQDLAVKLDHSLAELHNQQPETAYKFRDAIAGFYDSCAAKMKGK